MQHLSKSPVRSTRRKLIEAGVELMRARGFNGTTVDDICQAAGVTKGGFFHYFESKEEVAEVALATFDEARNELYRQASFRQVAEPLERVFGRLDFDRELIEAGTSKGCLAGMLAQELAASRKEFRSPCHDFFARRADDFAADLTAAKTAHAPQADFEPRSVATFYLAIVQGSHILAKTSGDSEVRLENLEHFRTYLRGLFGMAEDRGKKRHAGTSTRN
jgi:TetR/AcrR family transcriptional repressor of nem operon